MFKVYVLYSRTHNKLYIGYSSNLRNRILSHNKLGIKDWTKNYRPWLLIHIEEFNLKKDAIKREKELKSGKGREFIRKQILPDFFCPPGSYPPKADSGSSPVPGN